MRKIKIFLGVFLLIISFHLLLSGRYIKLEPRYFLKETVKEITSPYNLEEISEETRLPRKLAAASQYIITHYDTMEEDYIFAKIAAFASTFVLGLCLIFLPLKSKNKGEV